MKKDIVIVLGESSFMDFSHLRQSLIRIPEVAEVLSAAQKHWDTLRGVKSLDLNNSFYNSDDFFKIHPEYKNFLTDLVQFALFQRLKNQGFNIEYVFSNINFSRSHFLVLNLQNLKEFVFKHPAVKSFNTEPKVIRALHAVHSASKYSLYRLSSCGIKNLKTSSEVSEVFNEIDFIQTPHSVLNLGLGQNFKFMQSLIQSGHSKDVQDSILLDERLRLVFGTYVGLGEEEKFRHH